MQIMRRYIIITLVSISFISCKDEKVHLQRITFLETEIEHLQNSNNSLLDRLSELSVISMNDSESIKESLKSINEHQEYIAELTDKIHEKDSINFALVSNLKRSLINIEDEIDIEVRGSAVYVSLSDQLLFNTASSKVNQEAYSVLEQVSRIINDHSEIDVLVQGHTDDIPISNKHYKDNWELSTSRAASVVRILQENYGVIPERLTAAGRGEYVPVSDNRTTSGRSGNRRTEIIITPKLSQFFELLGAPELVG